MPGRYFVTTPIYYVNDAPHLGHAYSTITADALARWHRLVGDEVWFTTGTDEHGLKIQRAADERGIAPIEQADWASARFQEAWALLDISCDDYVRTTEARHHQATQAFLQKVYDAGHIYSATYSGWYCVSCEAYYAPDELVDDPDGGDVGLCPIHLRPVEELTEENWFFRLSAFADRLEAWLTADPSPVRPEGKRNEALGLVRGGLQDISITRRSLTWGVPVPWDADQVFYVWFDALINYATSVGYGADPERFAEWWPHVHHVIGKDIIRFHAVYWPAMLMAAGEEPPHQLDVHGYLLVGGAKMSKTAANKIAPDQLVGGDPAEGYPALGVDGFRHHFLHDQRFGPDGDLSLEGMVQRYNTDLANNLGNLLARVTTVVAKKCDGIGPAPRADSPLAAVAAEVVAATTAGVGGHRARRRPSTPPGASSARPTPCWRTPSPGRPTPAPRSTACWATPSRCCASSPCWPRPPSPAPRPRSGAASASTATRRPVACPTTWPGAATPAACRWRRAPPCSPA